VERRTPVTSGLDTRPEGNLEIPHETYVPLVIAVGLTAFFVALMVNAYLAAGAGIALAVVGVLWWTWRTEEDLK
jgi:cytochrome c oxidase subunit I+III